MKRAAVIVLVACVAGVGLFAGFVRTSTSAGGGAVPFIRFAAAGGHPTPGKWFRGIAVMYLSKPLARVGCEGAILGRTGGLGKALAARQERFYAPSTPGPAEIICAWKIPEEAAGKRLSAYAVGHTVNGWTEASGTTLGKTTWRVGR